MPPFFMIVDWSPSILYSDQTLIFEIKYGDPDSDDVEVTYTWNGKNLDSALNKKTGLLKYTCPKKGNGTIHQSTLQV